MRMENEEMSENSSGDTIDENVSVYTTKTIELLANGLIEPYKPHLTKVKEELKELTDKQSVLIEQLHNENIKISQSLHSQELQEMFTLVREYHAKLLNIKRDMKTVHERSTKLKKRSNKLQEHKEKELRKKNQQLKQEQDLIAKPNTGYK